MPTRASQAEWDVQDKGLLGKVDYEVGSSIVAEHWGQSFLPEIFVLQHKLRF